MKRFFQAVLSFLFLFLVISPVSAQNLYQATPSAISPWQERFEERKEHLETVMERVREKREALRVRLQDHQATRAARLAEVRKQRIRVFFNRLTERIQAAIDRLEKLIARIESRLGKIESAGEEIETASIREELDAAKDKLAEASAALSQAQTSLEDILLAENPKEIFIEVRDLVKGIKEQLIEVHRTLVHLIGDIRGLRVGARGEE